MGSEMCIRDSLSLHLHSISFLQLPLQGLFSLLLLAFGHILAQKAETVPLGFDFRCRYLGGRGFLLFPFLLLLGLRWFSTCGLPVLFGAFVLALRC